MDASPFFKLPAEIRDRIYQFVVLQDDFVSIAVNTGLPVGQRVYQSGESQPQKILPVDLEFAKVCRQAWQEAVPIFYNINSFTIVTKYFETEGDPATPEARRPFCGLQKWLSAIGPKNAKRLSRVRIDLGWYGVKSPYSRITELMDVAKEEIRLLPLPASAVVLRAAYFVEVFPPIGHLMRYIDIPLTDKDKANRILETTTSSNKAGLPPYTTNREVVNYTMDLFKAGFKELIL